MKKKYILITILITVTLFLIIELVNMIRVNMNYTIDDSIDSIQAEINNFYNDKHNIQIKKTLDLKNKKIILFLIDNKYIGKSILEKGTNNKYSISTIGYSKSKFYRSNIENFGADKYLIIVGRNYQFKISKIKALVVGLCEDFSNNKTNVYEIPSDNNEFYIYTFKVESDLIYGYLPAKLFFLDGSGKDIKVTSDGSLSRFLFFDIPILL